MEITLSGVGSILGAGIYVLIGKAAGLSGNSLWLSFLFAAIAAGLTAISYMELSSMFPKAGAEYEYVRNAFGEFLGLLIGLMVVFVEIISSSTVALGFAGYFGVLWTIWKYRACQVYLRHQRLFSLHSRALRR